MNDEEIRQWHLANGIDYIEEDWGPRTDTGESDVAQVSEGIRFGDNRPLWFGDKFALAHENENSYDWEHPDFQWPPARQPGDQELHEKLEEFFTPYIAMLPHRQGELIRQVMNDQLTYEEVAHESSLSVGKPRKTAESHAFTVVRTALRALTRLIAEDDPEFTPVNRPRDYEAEAAAAERMFDRYMRGERP